jgi:hypothetical protein
MRTIGRHGGDGRFSRHRFAEFFNHETHELHEIKRQFHFVSTFVCLVHFVVQLFPRVFGQGGNRVAVGPSPRRSALISPNSTLKLGAISFHRRVKCYGHAGRARGMIRGIFKSARQCSRAIRAFAAPECFLVMVTLRVCCSEGLEKVNFGYGHAGGRGAGG